MFQGVEGAYSHEAMCRFLDSPIQSYHVDTWKDAMEEIKQGRALYAVLPIENSTAGIVQDNYDLLTSYDHVIVGEQIIPCQMFLPVCREVSLQISNIIFSPSSFDAVPRISEQQQKLVYSRF